MLLQMLYRPVLSIGILCAVVACTSPLTPPPSSSTPQTVNPPTNSTPKASLATNPRDYRRDGAAHLYAKNSDRIYSGKLPPLLYAIGVLQVDINASGAVTALHWMRAPKQAPEVVTEIERTVRAAAPFPVPLKLGHVTYTDTWLWDESGHFQLDTLTEGQL